MPPDGESFGSLLAEGARQLARSGSPSPRLDALILLVHATGLPRTALLAHPERTADPRVASEFHATIARRLEHEPIAYIVGEREFYGRTFRVDRRVLIPRPETEALVDLGLRAVRWWRDRGVEPRVVDVGTGSGAIAITLAAEAGVEVVATDIASDALDVARENALRSGQGSRVRLLRADLLSGVSGPIHVLLANLPYLPLDRSLPPDVARFEPAEALFGGPAGTEPIERLLLQARPLLVAEAAILLELDEGQGEAVSGAIRSLYPGADVEVLPDHAGLQRVVQARLPDDGTAPRPG